jgi:transcription-repair coupling factor (superfamily II helicase)
LAQNETPSATGKLFADLARTPAVQSLARRLEPGGALSCPGIAVAAQPFFAALLRKLFPQRPVVVVTENLKTQESFQQDLETWLGATPLFYPAWEIFPHEGKLPHADVISDRLQALIALSGPSTLLVASVTALLQKTFAPGDLKSRTRALQRGDKADPLDLIEWLENQGYESEAQVTQKGEIAMRGGIVDIFPPTSPWPVRLEFFGDELESLREFDPLTQISRGEISTITLPPAGELGILKRRQNEEGGMKNEPPLATLLDYLPRETIFLLCEPESLTVHAEAYEQQVPPDDQFFISWPDFLIEFNRRSFASVELSDDEAAFPLTPALSLIRFPKLFTTARSGPLRPSAARL